MTFNQARWTINQPVWFYPAGPQTKPVKVILRKLDWADDCFTGHVWSQKDGVDYIHMVWPLKDLYASKEEAEAANIG